MKICTFRHISSCILNYKDYSFISKNSLFISKLTHAILFILIYFNICIRAMLLLK